MKNTFVTITLLLFLLSVNLVSSASIVGVSPGNVNLKDVLRGGYAERYITITLDSDNPVRVTGELRGEVADWIELPENLSISKNNPGRYLLKIRPPADMPNGEYSGFLRIGTEAIGDEGKQGHATGNVIAVIDVVLKIEITDVEILSCRAGGFKVSSAEKGDDIRFDMNVNNDGNIRLNPRVVVDIWDLDQISIVKTKEFKGTEILPTKQDELTFYLETNDLELGQYWVDISVPDCYSTDTLTFDVLEEGALKASGILTKIFSKLWVEVDETIPIIATFKNTGEKQVDAYFKGQITKEGKIIQIIESEKSSVPINEFTNFTFFFTPNYEGKYIASGRVFYDKKRTFESSTVINVKPKEFTIQDVILWAVYIGLATTMIFLFQKIRKEKRRYMTKLKAFKNE